MKSQLSGIVTGNVTSTKVRALQRHLTGSPKPYHSAIDPKLAAAVFGMNRKASCATSPVTLTAGRLAARKA